MALIDRQTLIDSFCSQCTVDKPETCSTIQYGDKWCNEVYTILNAPTVDAAPGGVSGRGKRMIHLEGNWYIDADETEFILLEQYSRPASEHYKKKTGQDVEIVRKVAGYYTTLRNAIKEYRDMLVRKAVSANEYARISGALRAVDEIDSRIEEMLKGVNS